MQARRTALLGLAAAVAAGMLVANGPAHTAPKRPKPNLAVTAIIGFPEEVLAAQSFGVKVLTGNFAAAPAGGSRLSLHLSRDGKISRGDLSVGSASVPRLGPWKTRMVLTDVKVPAKARGKYRVLACADARRAVREHDEGDNCHASRGTVTIVRGLTGTLTGTLDLYDSGSADNQTWDRSAQARLKMLVSGRGTDIRIVDDESRYIWLGSSTTTTPWPDCPATVKEDEGKDDDFGGLSPALPHLFGSARDAELSRLRLNVTMDYDVTGTATTCTGSVPISEARQNLTYLDLAQTSETDTKITYQVSGDWADEEGSQPSQWDTVSGTLTLQLD